MSADKDFLFPFTPYKIQTEFMSALYTALEDEKIAIFESPTGTGKSLSLICGALKWLHDYQDKCAKEAEEIIKSAKSEDGQATQGVGTNEPDWVQDTVNHIEKKKLATELQSKLEKQKRIKAKLDDIRKRKVPKLDHGKEPGPWASTQDYLPFTSRQGSPLENVTKEKEEMEEEDQDLVLNDYQSDDEMKVTEQDSSSDSGLEDDGEEEHVTKIYYCSRTHSQLTQFIHEVKKSPYGSNVKLVALGSRQNFCINDDVRQLKSLSKMNERCLELQKTRKDVDKVTQKKKRRKQDKGCPYNKFQGYKDLRDYSLAEVFDIEELVSLGKDLEVCPYYGGRYSIPQAQVVVLPYNTILHKSTREAVGVKLKGNIVIVDEAHNLMETINNIHSVELTDSQISASYNQLSSYFNKYRSRLKAKNLVYINQLLYVLNALKDFIGVTSEKGEDKLEPICNTKTTESKTTLETVNEFLFKARIDNLNLFKVKRYCERSLIARKLNGFVDRYQKKDSTESMSQFMFVESFLEALTNADKDGRVLVSKKGVNNKNSLKYLLLNPAVHFADVISEARAIIITGGTMQPTEEIKNVLLYSAGASPDRIMEFSCGHVIPPENLVAMALSRGPSNLELDFTYQNRDGYNMIDELGRVLVNLCTVIPGGIVVFFPSYDYEEKVHSRWTSTGTISKFNVKKRVFREPKQSNLVDQILGSYSRTIKWSCKSKDVLEAPRQTGAMLLSVVGGKMSEGINFADDLGRCIVMVGLPYPNINSPELKEKMEYLNKSLGIYGILNTEYSDIVINCNPVDKSAQYTDVEQYREKMAREESWTSLLRVSRYYDLQPTAGTEHYENICMKAVNQSIGRAIRHQKDYACILMADHRFARPSVRKKLPTWIQERVTTHARFGPAVGSICKFFAEQRRKQASLQI